MKQPLIALASLSLAILACSLLDRPEATEPAPAETAPSLPTSSPKPAADVLHDLAPPSLAGTDLESISITGADLDATDPAVAEFLAGLGVDPSELKISVAFAPGGGEVTFQAGAITIPGRDWATILSEILSASGSDANATWEVVTVGDRNVLRVAATADEIVSIAYYAAAGDTLYFTQSNDAEAAEEAISELPGQVGPGSEPDFQRPPPGSEPLTILLMEQLHFPVCVGEPPGRHILAAYVLDESSGGVQDPSYYFTLTSLTGVMDPHIMFASLPTIGGVFFFPGYSAVRWDSGGEQLRIEARGVPGEGVGTTIFHFPVKHCLQGTWQDGDRKLRILPPYADSLTAMVQTGTLCGQERVQAFSGTLNGQVVSGSDMMVCEPEECAEAGLVPKTSLVEFTGRVADDGMSVKFEWPYVSYNLEYDDGGNLIACTVTGTEPHSFTITRLVWEP